MEKFIKFYYENTKKLIKKYKNLKKPEKFNKN